MIVIMRISSRVLPWYIIFCRYSKSFVAGVRLGNQCQSAPYSRERSLTKREIIPVILLTRSTWCSPIQVLRCHYSLR